MKFTAWPCLRHIFCSFLFILLFLSDTRALAGRIKSVIKTMFLRIFHAKPAIASFLTRTAYPIFANGYALGSSYQFERFTKQNVCCIPRLRERTPIVKRTAQNCPFIFFCFYCGSILRTKMIPTLSLQWNRVAFGSDHIQST